MKEQIKKLNKLITENPNMPVKMFALKPNTVLASAPYEIVKVSSGFYFHPPNFLIDVEPMKKLNVTEVILITIQATA